MFLKSYTLVSSYVRTSISLLSTRLTVKLKLTDVLLPRHTSSPFIRLRLLTLESHHTADHYDASRSPILHVRHHLLDQTNESIEVGLKDVVHLVHRDALHWTYQADACITYWFGEKG